jgi:hypothetical protein
VDPSSKWYAVLVFSMLKGQGRRHSLKHYECSVSCLLFLLAIRERERERRENIF